MATYNLEYLRMASGTTGDSAECAQSKNGTGPISVLQL